MSKKKHEEHENHERWLVSYADFITLLFAFFVVMYSISSVNEGRFRTVSESIKAALHPVTHQQTSSLAFNIGQSRPSIQTAGLPGPKNEAVRNLRDLVKSMKMVSQFSVVQVKERENGDIVITIPDQVLFNSGEAVIRQDALPFLKGLAAAIVELDRHARVDGHTDNVPIRTAQFPSNWELSSARSVMVVRVLSELYGVPADHLAAVGHADTRPLTKNLDAEQRAKNRRVEVVILEQAPPSPVLLSGENPEQGEPPSGEAAQEPTLLDPAVPAEGAVPTP